MAIGGSGTQADPWTIGSSEDLVAFAGSTSYWAAGTYAKLTADIDLTGVTYTPIGNSSTAYSGTFDGDGHTIRNLTITSSGYFVGLFGSTASGSVLQNIGCVGFTISGGNNTRSGCLVGNSSGSITNCYATDCEVSGSDTGGIAGYSGGPISNCYAYGCDITGRGSISAIVGKLGTTYVSNCYAYGCTISGSTSSSSSYAGGVIGYTYNGTISNCSAYECTISGLDYGYAAGVIGYDSSGTLSNCCAYKCTISGRSFDSAGIAGFSGATLSNCYAYGCDITCRGSESGAPYYTGGIAGHSSGTLSNCYAYGCDITVESSVSYQVGGVVGYLYAYSGPTPTASNCATYGGTHGSTIAGSGSGTITNCYTSNDVTSAVFHTQGFWNGTGVEGTTYLSWDFTTPVWYWDARANLPVLQQPTVVSSPFRVKVSGTWKDVEKTLVKINGTWKEVDQVFTRIDGVWKEV